jgi:hypothetical protein
MSNLYEKQALENYLNDGITHGKKISYGSLGRNKNEIPRLINYEKQPIGMNTNPNSTKNENNSKMSVTELADKTKSIILNQKYELLQKLTKEEQMYENLLNSLN